MSGEPSDTELARERLALLERKIELQEGLPFLYGWKWYKWAREFYDSTEKLALCCAANQISKSSTQIRKCANWATNRELWPILWPHKKQPVQFWYLYPSANQASIEFETKWQEFLPQGKFKDDPIYGWKKEVKNKDIFAIHFNSGVHVYFKSYGQDAATLQTGTCDAVFCDEELPVDTYDELIFRISASDGYFNMVFTATLGQEFWRQVMEPGPKEVELLPEAFKQQVSMYDCLTYEDGTPSHWTLEKIQKVKNRCKSEAEVLRRVYGRFIKDKGLKFPQFDMKRHLIPALPVPADWHVYVGADPGSGGKTGHPSALAFVAVRPDFRFGRVFLGWRGDGIQTTSGDVVNKYIELKEENKLVITGRWYDWGDKDFDIISTSMGEPFAKAEKGHDKGESVVNTLFKNDMLFIDDGDELNKLAAELSSLNSETPKTKAKDDFCDALRYAVTLIPWDWSCITGEVKNKTVPVGKKETDLERQLRERRGQMTLDHQHRAEIQRVEDEIEEWNDLYGG